LAGLLAMGLTLTAARAQVAQLGHAGGDPVLLWNDQTNQAIQKSGTDAFRASRALALESIAVLDTIRSIGGTSGFLVRLPVPGNVKPEIAVAAAAHTMLLHLFPARRAALDAVFDASLANEQAGRARSVAFGVAVAEAVFAVRDRDGWNASGGLRIGTTPGQWKPTPPDFLPPLAPQWATLQPFALTKPGQFRPEGPPPPGSAAFREATAATAAIGAARSTVRTAAQTEIARYWSDAIGTYAPAGHWNAIAASLMEPLGLGLDAEAELFAKLNVAMADAGIAIADAKYTWWFWRPITVIRSGGGGSAPVPDWTSLLDTPNHPSYISGHSGFSGAAATILTDRFGVRKFSFTSASLPGVTRSFANFEQAAEEAAVSRVYGGIHYAFDNADGLATGRAVGAWTLAAFQRIAEDHGPIIVMDRLAGGEAQTLAGFALDNVSPPAAVAVRPEGGEPFTVPVDDRGRFAVPRARLGRMERREIALTVVSGTGRTAISRQEIDRQDDGGTFTAPVDTK
jgi:membrane-associated phospholipid phosphatase